MDEELGSPLPDPSLPMRLLIFITPVRGCDEVRAV